jgi:excisionase family DNA binding protein
MSTTPRPDPLVNADWVIDRLGLDDRANPRHRVYQLVRSGALPHVRLGRSVKFDRHVVEEWIRRGGTHAQGAA